MTNLQTPLQASPVALWADAEWQMSFAERAVLEGILAQLQPRVSIEIGVAAGGSLRRVARHSDWVHAFDLQRPAEPVSPTTVMHVGDSHETLPPLLGTLHSDVDFALVDGDHSNTGVYEDLVTLLEHPRCARALVLAHDVAHPPVRDGIIAAAERCDRHIAYFDLDFFPGYVFRKGAFAGESWGGFALIIAGEAGTEHPQDLYGQIQAT